MLHGIGFFIESLRDTRFPAPQELVVDDSRLQAVADYLDRGLVHENYRGFSWCRICHHADERMGSTDLTDGVWLWPAGLSHYLRCHSVGLPEEFMTHVLAAASVCQPASDAVADFGLWVEWARRYRSPALRDAITRAQCEDDRLAAIARSERAEANRSKFGKGTATCIWAGCHEQALTSMVFCEHHLPEMSDERPFHAHAYGLLRKALQSTAC